MQAEPLGKHICAVPQAPLTQFCEQQEASDMQAEPLGKHICAVPQAPLTQS
jgi:hypothetical protein